MTEEEMIAKFEEWWPKLRRCFTPDIHIAMESGAKQAYLQGRQDEAKESKLGGCYNLLCHIEKVQSEKKIVELQEEMEGLKRYEVRWWKLKDQLRRDRGQGHLRKTARAWVLMQEFEKEPK